MGISATIQESVPKTGFAQRYLMGSWLPFLPFNSRPAIRSIDTLRRNGDVEIRVEPIGLYAEGSESPIRHSALLSARLYSAGVRQINLGQIGTPSSVPSLQTPFYRPNIDISTRNAFSVLQNREFDRAVAMGINIERAEHSSMDSDWVNFLRRAYLLRKPFLWDLYIILSSIPVGMVTRHYGPVAGALAFLGILGGYFAVERSGFFERNPQFVPYSIRKLYGQTHQTVQVTDSEPFLPGSTISIARNHPDTGTIERRISLAEEPQDRLLGDEGIRSENTGSIGLSEEK